MRKQTQAKKRKAANPKRKVAKKVQRKIRGGAEEGAYVIQPIVERRDFGTPDDPDIHLIFSPGVVILPGTVGVGTKKYIGRLSARP